MPCGFTVKSVSSDNCSKFYLLYLMNTAFRDVLPLRLVDIVSERPSVSAFTGEEDGFIKSQSHIKADGRSSCWTASHTVLASSSFWGSQPQKCCALLSWRTPPTSEWVCPPEVTVFLSYTYFHRAKIL